MRKASVGLAGRRPPALDFSGAAEADGDFPGLDEDGHVASPLGELQHLRKSLFVLQHVYILERNFAASVRLPGAGGVGSEIFSEDQNLFVHFAVVVRNFASRLKISARRLNCK